MYHLFGKKSQSSDLTLISQKYGAYCLLFCFIAFSSFGFYTIREGIVLKNWNIKNSELFNETILSKKALANKLTRAELALLPDSIKMYSFISSERYKNDKFDCEMQVSQIKKSYEEICEKENKKFSEKEFATYWKEKLKLCYLKYKKTVPVLYFEFQHNDSDTYILDSVVAYIHAGTGSLSYDDNLIDNNAEFIKETIVMDSKIIGMNQVLPLKKKYAIKKTFFELELRLLPEKFWKGNLDKNTFLLDISFRFERKKDGHIDTVKSDPFLIDL